ncbi:MAG: hydrogen gas-evolving membrane-bound hydrogenase subunit E [Hyphomicrobiaceae bacterium]
MQRTSIAFAVIFFGLVFASVALNHSPSETLRPLARNYTDLVPRELGATNVITGILLHYRAFDTLGEVAVLFIVAAAVGLVLGYQNKSGIEDSRQPGRPASEIVQTASRILTPLIAIFAAYIIMNGHLSAGGGFQGGAVLASCVILWVLADAQFEVDVELLSVLESVAGVLFVVVGIAGLIFAGGFLDTRTLPLGQLGAFFSAGAIPILSLLLGIKVGSELSVIVAKFRT